jgi:hypothetical protein
MSQTTNSVDYVKLSLTSDTFAPYVAGTEPTGATVVDLRGGLGNEVANFAELLVFGQGDADETGTICVAVWTKCGTAWVAVIVAVFDFALSSTTGVSTTTLPNSLKTVDTYTLTAGLHDPDVVSVFSPGNDIPGRVTVDLRGSQKLQIVRIDDNSSITNVAALVRGF